MKNLLKKINRISTGVWSSLILGVGLMTLLTALGSEARADTIISEEFTWKALSSAEHTCQTFQHTVVGPGMISIRLKMNPFRERMFAMSKEDIITSNLPDFAEYKGFTINGAANVNPDSFIGKPIDRIVKYKIPGKTFNLSFKICNPVNCNFAGACSQPASAASVIIDYTPDSASGSSTVASAQSISWATQADGWRGKNGQRYVLQCPSGGTISGRIWGTGLYTDDSSICTAAVHAGLITAASGGVVTIEIRPGASTYNAAARNGVASRAYGGWAGSFIFVKTPITTNTTIFTGSTNLSKKRPAKQSSKSQWSKPNDADGAVDSIKNGSYGFHTNKEKNPWWQVDLGEVKPLTGIRIFNRLDCCAERARTIQILLSNDGANWTTVYSNNGTVFGGNDGKPLSVSLKGNSARYVRLQLAETNYFHLDEVEIY